ncbi:uncharacterized protein LOC119732686 [Patiria miniata]|uniref:Arrestin C-terminal-like domain-containing protein n=1 Tax=Patiria miniata TaxID=46514 RepID=A0A914AE95_PATMI|nr:uncharacterized protein LOC119732686 [Patiria miniata]
MGRIRTFDIVVDANGVAEVRGVPIYRPGGHVTGVVHLALNTPREDIGEISIKLQGRAKTNWSEVVRSGRSVIGDQPVTYTGTETYIDEKISLWKQTHSHQRLNRGPFQFPFQFQIPNENLPTAYEGTSGSVLYNLKCEISGESSLSYAKTIKTIGIAGRPLDLNSVPSAMLPIHGESETLMSSLCCITGSIKVIASADKRAYIPGETAYITAIIHGSSGTRYEVDLKLVEEATFRGTGSVFTSPGVSVARPGSCQRSRVVFRKKTSGVLQRQGQTTIQREPLIIPDFKPLVDSGFQGCSIIDVNYFISINPILSRLRQTPDTEIQLPVTIGRVPFTALPSYHASSSHMSHPAEPPPSYETATSYRHNTPQQPNITAFVNQAYSPVADDTTPSTPRDQSGLTVELPPIASSSRSEVRANQSETQQSEDQHDSRPTPPRPPPVIPPPGYRSKAGTGIRGIVNPTFSGESRNEEDASDQEKGGEATSVERSPSDASRQQERDSIVQLEGAVLHSPLPPPPSFSSATEDASKESPVNTIRDSQQDNLRRPNQDERRDRALSQDSLTVPYFLPAYERQLLGRVTSEENIEEEAEPVGVRLHSFFLPISQESDLDLDSLVDPTEVASIDRLPPPSPWKDEQPSLSVFQTPNDDVPSAPEESDKVPILEEATTTSVSETQMSVPQAIKTDVWEENTSEKDDEDDDSDKITIPDVSEVGDSKPSETSFVPFHSPEKSTTSTRNQDLNHAGSSSDFANVPFPESRETSPAKARRSGESLQRSDRPTRLELHSTNLNKQWPDGSPVSPSNESLFGNVRIVHDTSRQHSRTPSPYFHPDDGRRDRDDASSVSSFGSYTPSAHTPKERRRSDRDEDHSRARSSDHIGGREISTLPRSKSSSGGLRESALGSLDRRKRVLKYSTSHPTPNQDARGNPSDRRHGSRTMDLHSTTRIHKAPVPLDGDPNQSRNQADMSWHPSNRTQLSSHASQDTLPPSTSPSRPSHVIISDASQAHHNLARSREDSTKKRSSYTSAIENQRDTEWQQIASSAPSSRRYHTEKVAREERPKKMKPCLAYHHLEHVEDAEDEFGSDKHRLETFV